MMQDTRCLAKRLRTLVVEDEDRLRELLIATIEEMGCDAVGVRTAEQAKCLLEQRPADLLLLDLNLPIMGGMAFLDWFRQSHAQTPVVIITAFGSLKSAQQAIRHGVVDFITKPFHLGEIEEALHRAQRCLMRAAAPMSPAQVLNEKDSLFAPGEDIETDGTLAALERRVIIETLKRRQGNRTAAAAELGISRRTLYNRLTEYAREDARSSRQSPSAEAKLL